MKSGPAASDLAGRRAAECCRILDCRSKPSPPHGGLECEFGCQLYPARASATQERVANPHVAGCRELVSLTGGSGTGFAIPVGHQPRSGGIGNERRKERIGKVRVVQNVEEFRAQLHAQTFGKLRVLIKREVPLLEAGTAQGVATFVAKVPRSRLTVLCSARDAIRLC